MIRLSKLVDLELRTTQALHYGADLTPSGVERLSIDGLQVYRVPERGLPATERDGSRLDHFNRWTSRLNNITEIRLTNLQWGADWLNEKRPFIRCLFEHSRILGRFTNLRKLSMIFSFLSIFRHPVHAAIWIFAQKLPRTLGPVGITELELQGKFRVDDCVVPYEIPEDLKNLQRLSTTARAIGMDTERPIRSLPPSVQHLDIWLYHFSFGQVCQVLYNIFHICNRPDSRSEGKIHAFRDFGVQL